MHKTNINFESPRWKRSDPKLEQKIKKILKKSISMEKKLHLKSTEISVLLTDTKLMKKLNLKFRKKNKDTDILSFPSEKPNFFKKKIIDEKIYLGDLALSYSYIKNQNVEFKNYFSKILVHGFLHLIGHDHDRDKSFVKMERSQNKILNLL